MVTRVVGVHGIGNRRAGLTAEEAADRIAQTWQAGLAAGPGGDADISVTVAYYADRIAGETAQGAPAPEDLTEPEGRLLLAWAAALGAPDEVAQGRMTQPLRQAADWIARRFGLDSALVRAFVSLFCREVEGYFGDRGGARARAQDAVLDAVVATRADVVVAHSLGSVVAYEALWRLQDRDVPLLITLGSPLGMPDVVFDRLVPAAGHRPPRVRRWVNLADRGDLVAVPRWLGTRFDGVDVDREASIGVVDFHRVKRYLATAEIAEALTSRA